MSKWKWRSNSLIRRLIYARFFLMDIILDLILSVSYPILEANRIHIQNSRNNIYCHRTVINMDTFILYTEKEKTINMDIAKKKNTKKP